MYTKETTMSIKVKEVIVTEGTYHIPKIEDLDHAFTCGLIGNIACTGKSCTDCIYDKENFKKVMNYLSEKEI